MKLALIVGVEVVSLLSGCSSTPDVVYRYYPSQARTTVTVTQTIDCDASKTRVVVVETPSVTTVYSADKSKAPASLKIKELSSAFADSDIAFTWFEDGRLKSVGQSSTGQGESIAKSALTLAAALAPVGGAATNEKKLLPECDVIASRGGGKPVSLTYSKQLAFNSKEVGKSLDFDMAPQSRELYAQLQGQLPVLKLEVGALIDAVTFAGWDGAASESASNGAVSLLLRRTSDVALSISTAGSPIWTAVVAVPTASSYSLPIPKAAFFGKQSFGLTLAESGAITALSYGKTSGVSGGLNALTALDSAVSPQSDAAKAAAVKSQADLIAQQQRLARCQAQPDKCQ